MRGRAVCIVLKYIAVVRWDMGTHRNSLGVCGGDDPAQVRRLLRIIAVEGFQRGLGHLQEPVIVLHNTQHIHTQTRYQGEGERQDG